MKAKYLHVPKFITNFSFKIFCKELTFPPATATAAYVAQLIPIDSCSMIAEQVRLTGGRQQQSVIWRTFLPVFLLSWQFF